MMSAAMGRSARAYVSTHCGLEPVVERWNRFLAATEKRTRSPRPALSRFGRDDVASRLAADLAATATDLGIREDDQELLPDLAEMLVDLGVDPSG